jgi:NADPH:quinone reductase-like Zn-dependent oxidoreductase
MTHRGGHARENDESRDLGESRQPLVVDEVELPDSLAHGQVLVKVHYSGICAFPDSRD